MANPFGNIAQNKASVWQDDDEWNPGPRARSHECKRCHTTHFTISESDELIWWCIEALSHTLSKCHAWHSWLELCTDGNLKATMSEEAIVTMAMMAETKEERRMVACKLLEES